MTRKFALVGAALSLATTLAWTTLAAPNDYAFEPVSANVNRGEVTVAVRLMHKPTGKPVTDAVITQTRIDTRGKINQEQGTFETTTKRILAFC